MKNDSKEIREIINDIQQIIKLNESYILPDRIQEEMPDETDDFEIPEEPGIPGKLPINSNDGVEAPNKIGGSNADGKIKEIRKMAILLIAELDPETDPAYKVVKSIWDSCDKYLSKDTPKETINK